jgi:hypothetical protein
VWRPRAEPILDRETVDGIIRLLMAIHADLELLVVHFGLLDDDEEDDDDA